MGRVAGRGAKEEKRERRKAARWQPSGFTTQRRRGGKVRLVDLACAASSSMAQPRYSPYQLTALRQIGRGRRLDEFVHKLVRIHSDIHLPTCNAVLPLLLQAMVTA